MKDALTIGCGNKGAWDYVCGIDGLCPSCLRVKEALELQRKEILEKIDEFENKHIVMAQNIVEDEDWSKFKKQIISQDNSPKEQERKVGLTTLDSVSKRVNTQSPADTLCSNCGKPNSKHIQFGKDEALYCDDRANEKFTPIADEGVKG